MVVRIPQFEVFDHHVRAAFHEACEPMPEVVRQTLARDDTDWDWYTAQLFALDISTKTRRSLLAAKLDARKLSLELGFRLRDRRELLLRCVRDQVVTAVEPVVGRPTATLPP